MKRFCRTKVKNIFMQNDTDFVNQHNTQSYIEQNITDATYEKILTEFGDSFNFK